MATSLDTGSTTTQKSATPALTRYREAEAWLWSHYGVRPAEQMIDLEALRLRVRVQEVGDGFPLLFIHGGPNAGSTFAPLVASMTGRRCLILDRPGCGLSGPVEYSMPIPQMAVQVLAATLDGLGIERIDLVGSSFGGSWAMWFALAHPERVGRIVLLGAPAFVPDMLLPGFMKMMVTPAIGSLIARMPPSVAGSKWVYGQMGHSKRVVESVIPFAYWEWSVRLSADTDTMANDLRAIRKTLTRRGSDPDVEFSTEQFRSISAPTLLYWGDADAFGGANLAHATGDLIPGSIVEIPAGAGHLVWLDDPARAAASISSFLDDRPVGGAEEQRARQESRR